MADPGLVKRMVDDGWGRDAAIENLDALAAAIAAQLDAGKSVRIDGVCRLSAPSRIVKVHKPGYLNHLRQRRQVKLAKGEVLEDGEPYPDPNFVAKPVSTYGMGR